MRGLEKPEHPYEGTTIPKISRFGITKDDWDMAYSKDRERSTPLGFKKVPLPFLWVTKRLEGWGPS